MRKEKSATIAKFVFVLLSLLYINSILAYKNVKEAHAIHVFILEF